MTDERIGEIAIPNVVPRLSDTPGGVDWLGPPLGSCNEEIFQHRLGLTEAEMRRLGEAGVI